MANRYPLCVEACAGVADRLLKPGVVNRLIRTVTDANESLSPRGGSYGDPVQRVQVILEVMIRELRE